MKILWMSDSPTLFTGFGTVTREVLGRLHRLGHQVAAVGWGHKGWPYDRASFPYDIYPGQGAAFGRDVLSTAVEHFHPDVFIVLGDAWMVEWLKDFQFPHPCKLVLYFPVDGIPFPRVFGPLLQKVDAAIAYSRFGQRETLAAVPGVDVGMIYHGVDVETFRPLGQKSEIQQKLGLGKKFIVGCVARNQPRKQYPILMKAFARFMKDHDDAMLYIHADPNDIGWDLHQLVDVYGLNCRVMFSQEAQLNRGADPGKLNVIYNLMDIMVLPTLGEGFGIPIIEAMAAGVPVMATRCSACIELIEGRGELVEVKTLLAIGRHGIEHAVPDIDDMERKMRLLYADPELRERHSAAGLAFAHELRWDNIMPQWQELLGRWQTSAEP